MAHSTSATFLRATGSDLVRKSSGEGARLVRDLFKLAKENAPCIVFLDEIDAVGTKRFDSSSRGEQEVQRTLLELLNQLDGFESRGDVKVIMATNRIDSLDPALIRPGRIDRKIELPKPDEKTKIKIFNIHTTGMTLAKDVKFEKIVSKEREISGADCRVSFSQNPLTSMIFPHFRQFVLKLECKPFEHIAKLYAWMILIVQFEVFFIQRNLVSWNNSTCKSGARAVVFQTHLDSLILIVN